MECTWNVSLCVLGNELHHFNISVVRCYLQGSTAILCLDINGGTGAEEYPGRNVLIVMNCLHECSPSTHAVLGVHIRSFLQQNIACLGISPHGCIHEWCSSIRVTSINAIHLLCQQLANVPQMAVP